MNDQKNEEQENESFEALLEAYGSGMEDHLKVGDKIKCNIISIGKDTVFVDTGTKVDGAVEKQELLDEQGECPYAEGDALELYVVEMNEHEIRLSKAISGIGGLEVLREAYESKVPVEGKVTETCKGGFRVQVLHKPAFCPISQIDTGYTENPGEFVGQVLEFLINQMDERGKNIVVSRRRLLEAQIEEERERFFSELKAGDELEGTVSKLMPYGAFVTLVPGVEGMVHVSELSWSRVEKPEEAVSANQRVLVKVLSVEEGKSKNQKKIALSMKQVEDDPWEKVEEMFQPGQTIQGKATRLAKFGVFVEIAPGIEGLVHISEMSYIKRVLKPEDVVDAGQAVSVMIKDIDPGQRRISLSIRDAEGDPWLEIEERFSPGKAVKGTVVKKAPFGYFIELEPGITGLLPKSKISAAVNASDLEKAKPGDTLEVKIMQMDVQARKISLTPFKTDDDTNWKKFAPATSNASMGELAEKLQEALKSNKKG